MTSKNCLGYEIQVFSAKGWVPESNMRWPTRYQAALALAAIAGNGGLERRVYEAMGTPD
jgi:hypothetical protein